MLFPFLKSEYRIHIFIFCSSFLFFVLRVLYTENMQMRFRLIDSSIFETDESNSGGSSKLQPWRLDIHLDGEDKRYLDASTDLLNTHKKEKVKRKTEL